MKSDSHVRHNTLQTSNSIHLCLTLDSYKEIKNKKKILKIDFLLDKANSQAEKSTTIQGVVTKSKNHRTG